MKKSKFFVATLTAAALVIGSGAFAACNNTPEGEGEGDKPPVVTTTEYTVTLNVGEGTLEGATSLTTVDGKLASLPTPTAPENKTFLGWYTALVDGQKVTTEYEFSANTTIYALFADEGETGTTVTLNYETLTLGIGNLEAELSATVSTGEEVTWESDNPTIVAVNEDSGYIEAFKPGAATITATVVGGTATATCEVVVEKGYYLIGGMDSAWNTVGVFGQSGVIYFMPTQTEGIYSTGRIELPELGGFQVALVGYTASDWSDTTAIRADCNSTDANNALAVNGNNFKTEKHGYYTITLDLTGDKAVVSGVLDEEINDGNVEKVYYLIGGMNNWTLAADKEAAGAYAFTSNGDGTYSLTTQLTKGWEFKVVIAGMQYNGEMGESAIPRELIGNNGTATEETAYQLTWTSSANIGVGVTGWYTFTLNPNGGTNDQLSYTFSATNPAETPDAE